MINSTSLSPRRPRRLRAGALAASLLAMLMAGCGSELGDEAALGAGSPSGPTVTVAVPHVLDTLPTVELVDPASTNVGDLPRFTWRPIEGAAEYRLVVTGEYGPLWAWQGPDTTVRFGGVDDPQPGYIGIRLTEPGWWSVVALDDAGAVLAVSSRRSVSPDGRVPGDATSSGDDSAEAEPEAPGGPVDPTSVDPCTLLSVEEVSAALGASVHPGVLDTGAGGTYRNCTWVSTVDEFDEVQVSISNNLETYNPSGWTRGEIVAVEGLGDQSFVITDFGVRVGFTHSGVVVTVVALVGKETAPTWIELARTVEARLSGA